MDCYKRDLAICEMRIDPATLPRTKRLRRTLCLAIGLGVVLGGGPDRFGSGI